MNTVTDLRAELDRLADRAPSGEQLRRDLADRIAGRAKRRRTTALIAAAAAVVLVAGGAGIAGAVLSHRSAGPAGPTPVVSVPDVPLPPGSKLIRHELQPVTTPVTATTPKGLTGHMWMSAPGRLAVSFFDPAAAARQSSAAGTAGGATTATAGYTITGQRDETLRSYGPNGPTTPIVTRTQLTVGGHAATLDTAPADTNDDFGFPASERISWRLPDGQWIHVWTSGPGDKAALQQFAAGITNEPQTLDRTVGIGFTVPGLTVDSSTNSWPAVAYVGASLYLCPKGVDPMTSTYTSSTGSGSSGPSESGTGSGVGSGVGPDVGSSTETSTNQEPTARCVTAAVMNIPRSQLGSLSTTEAITVGDTVAHVDTTLGAAWADLGNGLTAIAGAPRNVHLSAPDLAALVASVRLSPAATMLPFSAGQGVEVGGTTVTSAGVVPMRSPVSSAAATAPVTAATDRPGGTASSEQAARSSAVSARSSAAAAASAASASAAAAAALTRYLDALTAGDCAAARQAAAPSFVVGNGELCGAARVSAHSTPENPAATNPNEREFAITLTTGGSADGSIPAGTLTWFYILQRQPDGRWLLTGGGGGA